MKNGRKSTQRATASSRTASRTLDEIARLAGTSKSTVSRVISNDSRISEKTRVKVNAIIDKLNYRPNLFAQALAGGRTGLIGVISSNIGSGFYAEVIRGIDLVFNQLGKRLLVSFAHYEQDYRALWQDVVLGGQVEGVVVLAPTSDFFKLAAYLTRIPVVLCAGSPPRLKREWRAVDRVEMNNAQGMEAIIADLANNGCHRILHAAGWSNNSDAAERRQAFLKAVARYQLKAESEYFGIIPADGRSAMANFLAQKRSLPDAIVCFNDSIALGILEAWHSYAGRDVPPPFALTGWDDSPAAAAVGLTSIAIPFIRLGEESAHLLQARIEDSKPSPPIYKRVELSIVRRDSTQFSKSRP